MGILLQDMYLGAPLFKGQSAAILIPWMIVALSVFMWIRTEPTVPRTLRTSLTLGLLGVSWVVITLLERFDGQGANYNTYMLPLIILFLIIKPVNRAQAINAASVLAVSTILMIFLAETAAILSDRRELVFTLGLRLVGIQGLSYGGGRWEGPFMNPNYAGPVAAFLVIYALSRTGLLKWLLLVPASLLLLASGSRSAFLGLAAAIALYFIFSRSQVFSRLTTWVRVLLTAISALIFVVFSFTLDPSLNGRVPIWPLYMDYWFSSPIKGVGTNAINTAIASGEIEPWNVHAHNLFLDLAGRYGLLAFAPVVLALLLALVISHRAAKTGSTVGLALIVAFIAIGLTEVHGSWAYVSEPIGWLIVGIVISNGMVMENGGFRVRRSFRSTSA